jgi:hypothetical protein
VTIAPFGSWPTPITSGLVVAAAVRLSELRTDGDDVVWSEGRPAEGGRTQLVRRAPDGTTTDLLPEGMDARTGVHEYGGRRGGCATGSSGSPTGPISACTGLRPVATPSR